MLNLPFIFFVDDDGDQPFLLFFPGVRAFGTSAVNS